MVGVLVIVVTGLVVGVLRVLVVEVVMPHSVLVVCTCSPAMSVVFVQYSSEP